MNTSLVYSDAVFLSLSLQMHTAATQLVIFTQECVCAVSANLVLQDKNQLGFVSVLQTD